MDSSRAKCSLLHRFGSFSRVTPLPSIPATTGNQVVLPGQVRPRHRSTAKQPRCGVRVSGGEHVGRCNGTQGRKMIEASLGTLAGPHSGAEKRWQMQAAGIVVS